MAMSNLQEKTLMYPRFHSKSPRKTHETESIKTNWQECKMYVR